MSAPTRHRPHAAEQIAVLDDGGYVRVGPLVIRPKFKDMGCGLALMQHSLQTAREAGDGWVELLLREGTVPRGQDAGKVAG